MTAPTEDCKFRGPYYPAGEPDWTCGVHNTVLDLVDPNNPNGPNYKKTDFYCPKNPHYFPKRTTKGLTDRLGVPVYEGAQVLAAQYKHSTLLRGVITKVTAKRVLVRPPGPPKKWDASFYTDPAYVVIIDQLVDEENV